MPAGTSRAVHAVHHLAPDLLLVCKPRGHREEPHAHAHRQRLRVLRGTLCVRFARTTVVLDARSAPLDIAPGRRHATEALADTWLVAERLDARGAAR